MGHIAVSNLAYAHPGGDTLFYDVELPADLGLDDRVVIGCAGAYTVSYASSFNGFAPPSNHFHHAPAMPLKSSSSAAGPTVRS